MVQQFRVLAALAKDPSLVSGIQRLTIAYSFGSREQTPSSGLYRQPPIPTHTTMEKHAHTHTNIHIHVSITFFFIKMRGPDCVHQEWYHRL